MRVRMLMALAGLSVLLISSPALAQRGHVRDRVRAGELRPLDQIIPGIRDRYPGEFYDAEGPLPGANGSPNYRIKWLTPDGRVVWFRADAHTGRIIGVEGGPREWRNGPPPRFRRGMRARPPNPGWLGRYRGGWREPSGPRGGWGGNRGGGRGHRGR